DLLRHVQVLPVHELSVRPDHFLGEVAKRRAEQAVLVGRANVLGGAGGGVDGYQTIGGEGAQGDTLARREGQGLRLRRIGDQSRRGVRGAGRRRRTGRGGFGTSRSPGQVVCGHLVSVQPIPIGQRRQPVAELLNGGVQSGLHRSERNRCRYTRLRATASNGG